MSIHEFSKIDFLFVMVKYGIPFIIQWAIPNKTPIIVPKFPLRMIYYVICNFFTEFWVVVCFVFSFFGRVHGYQIQVSILAIIIMAPIGAYLPYRCETIQRGYSKMDLLQFRRGKNDNYNTNLV